MKNQYLYLIVVLVILVIAAIGWYFFSAQGAFTTFVTKYYQYCPSNTTSISCVDSNSGGPFNGLLNCAGGSTQCSTSYMGTCAGSGSRKYLQCVYAGGGDGCVGNIHFPVMC